MWTKLGEPVELVIGQPLVAPPEAHQYHQVRQEVTARGDGTGMTVQWYGRNVDPMPFPVAFRDCDLNYAVPPGGVARPEHPRLYARLEPGEINAIDGPPDPWWQRVGDWIAMRPESFLWIVAAIAVAAFCAGMVIGWELWR